jgi:predicted GIY-YIG superfamily endonuclease/ribonuclease HI
MKDFALFTDVSLNPIRKIGIGACLVLPAPFLSVSFPKIEKTEITGRITLRRFKDTSSTKLELETVLWALGEQRKRAKGILNLYTDSQCISGLLKRKPELLDRDFLSRKTNLPLRNAPLYQRFYAFHDEFDFKIIQVDGHSKTRVRDTAHRIFSIVDREARRALKLWIEELRENRLDAENKTRGGEWCVYVLNCRNGCLYTGITNDLAQRLKQHERGKGSKYVRSWRPVELVKTISCKDAGEARRLEYELKRLTRKEKIVALNLEIDPEQ